jgi:hypothetical protein
MSYLGHTKNKATKMQRMGNHVLRALQLNAETRHGTSPSRSLRLLRLKSAVDFVAAQERAGGKEAPQHYAVAPLDAQHRCAALERPSLIFVRVHFWNDIKKNTIRKTWKETGLQRSMIYASVQPDNNNNNKSTHRLSKTAVATTAIYGQQLTTLSVFGTAQQLSSQRNKVTSSRTRAVRRLPFSHCEQTQITTSFNGAAYAPIF